MDGIALGIFDHILFFLAGIFFPILNIVRGKPDFEEFEFDFKMKRALYYGNGLFLWVGALVAGPSFVRRCRAWLSPSHWFRSRSEEAESAEPRESKNGALH